MARQSFQRGRSAGYWLAACVGLMGQEIQAADWTIQPRLSVGGTWSDNIEQVSTSKTRDFVTQVTPGVSASKQGGRVSFDLDYAPGLVAYASDVESARIDHRLQANGNAELMKRRFFVDFGSTAGQANLSSTGRGSDNLTAGGDLTNFFTYSISPYLVHHFGNYADSELRYRHAEVFNSDAVNTTVNDYTLTLRSGRRFSALPWTVSAGYLSNDNDTGTESTRRFVNASVLYTVNRHYAMRFNGGYEDNGTVNSDQDDSGVTWRVTGIWTPSARTSVQLGYGQRAFGNSFSLNMSHRARRAVFTARYSEETTNSARTQLERQIFPTEDAFGDPIDNPGLQPQRIPIDGPTLTDADFISRRFSGGMALNLRRGTASINGYYTDRSDSGEASNDSTGYGIVSSYIHQLSRGTSANIAHTWQQTSYEGESGDETYWAIDVSLVHQINSEWSGSVSYSHRDNDTDDFLNKFKENRVAASVTVVF